MAERDKPTDIDKLLAEVDAMTGGGPVAGRPAATPARTDGGGGRMGRVRTAAFAGVVGSGAVFVLFALLPFLRAGSGAIGAFIATFVAVVLLRRR